MKIILYLVITIGFGLSQIWGVAFILTLRGEAFAFYDLIKDGGLFFFASSLVISSFQSHLKIIKHVDVEETFFYILGGCLIIIFSCFGFASGFVGSDFEAKNGHNLAQLVLLIASVMYGLASESRLHKYINLAPNTQ